MDEGYVSGFTLMICRENQTWFFLDIERLSLYMDVFGTIMPIASTPPYQAPESVFGQKNFRKTLGAIITKSTHWKNLAGVFL
jgi:hypothetical protein